MEKSKYYIYSLIDPNTNEIRYIGKTNNPDNRLKRHLQSCYLEKYDKNTYKSNWIKSLLRENKNPIMEIIEECDLSTVNQREIYWIDKMKNDGFKLTNLSEGGEIGVDWTGRTHKKESIDKIKKSKKKYCNPVIQYDLDGNILNRYSSLTEASEKTGIHIYLISNCCKKKGHYTVGGGKFWRNENCDEKEKATTFRYENDKFDYTPYNKNIQVKSRKVCKYDLEGNLIEVFESVKSSATDCDDANIRSCCKRKINKKTGKFILVKGFTYRYYDETQGRKLK